MAIDNFIEDTTYSGVYTHQSAYSDGNYIWTTNGGSSSLHSGLYRYNMAGTLLTSNAAAVDDVTGADSSVVQMNGMDLKDGKLYIGAMNYPQGSDWPSGDHQSGNLTCYSYITKWDATTLAYEDKWEVGDSSVAGEYSAAKWTEGCVWHANSSRWFVCFHGDPVLEEYSLDGSGDFVYEARHTLPSVDNTNSEWNALGFEDVTCAGDYFYLNRHAATGDANFYVYKWNGTGFTYVTKYARFGTDYTQGINIQPGTNLLWCCERTTAGGETSGDITSVRVVGFDLEEFNTGVFTSFATTGVNYADANGVIISK